MLDLMKQVFKDKLATPAWQTRIRAMVPSYGTALNGSPEKVQQEWIATSQVLQLAPPPVIDLATPAAAPTSTPTSRPAPSGQPSTRQPSRASSDMAL
jgi:malate dehydrogenase (quinone)